MDNDNQLALEGQPHFGYFQALYRSFYSLSLYIDVGKRWKGWGIGYLLFIIALFCIPFTLRVMLYYTDYFDNQILAPLNLPDLYIQNGQVIFDKPMPYLIKNDQGAVISIIDTTGQIIKIDEKKWPDLKVLITKDTLYFREPEAKFPWLQSVSTNEPADIYEQKIYKGSNELFKPRDWIKSGGIMNMKYLGLFISYPMVFTMFASIIVMALLIFAFMAQVISSVFFSWSLQYAQASRLTAVASTPSLFIFFLLITANWWFMPGIGFILLALIILYFCIGVSALKNSSKKMARL